ncbi:MAG: type 2 lanthipeptide synthetase LanM family protein [Pseudorhodoplanes sp.]|uniref:type 2 lanthipeptide synthetase LanM family protein n=1 Tax=Pseudorhodoplanes sp. TaxID=1934341 RepID=UPI003D1420FA
MDAFFERMIERAATFDERLSEDFEPLPGRKDDSNPAALRLAAWCRAAANGDWGLFDRRLARDELSFAQVLGRFATAGRAAGAPPPAWISDAVWIEGALRDVPSGKPEPEPCAFEELLSTVVERAESRLWAETDERSRENLTAAAQACLRRMLLSELSELCAPALYERFAKKRAEGGAGTAQYDRFVEEMRTGGMRDMFLEVPVLLRLIALITRQWIDSSAEFVRRLDADLGPLRRDLLARDLPARVAQISGDLSDRHHGGRSVLIATFEDGARVVYKPKDLRLDLAWHNLVERLNRSEPPVALRAVRPLVREHYGWTEFIEHKGCADQTGCERFYRRAGAWLALLHCFAATDMHQENIIATGDHPVPIDLETILQTSPLRAVTAEAEGAASDAVADMIANSVMAVGLLPAYGRGPDNAVFAMGGMTADWNSRIKLSWSHVNTDAMRPAKTKLVDRSNPNLPHVDGRYAKFGEYRDVFIDGFEQYSKFLSDRIQATGADDLLRGFAGAPVRNVVRPTRFYSMLIQRLRNHRSMEDGTIWSAQADFVSRLSDWDADNDAKWPFLPAERAALLALNVPHFVSPSDGHDIRDASGIVTRSAGASGLTRARDRMQGFDAREIAWQADVIRANTTPPKSAETAPFAMTEQGETAPDRDFFLAEADRIATELSARAIRRGPSAAWMGLDWLGDAEVFQLVGLGPDLYNGQSGIAVFLAAHAAVTGRAASAELALAGTAHLRRKLKDRNAARFARSLGIGGATGMGSIVYALTVMAASLRDPALLADAHVAAELITDDLIAADRRLDVISGSAGGILGLLRLYRDTRADDVLARAARCGEHLLRQDRLGPQHRRSWVGLGLGARALNGMSHGAAGFAYALAALSEATGREEFGVAAAESLAFENSSYDADRSNWPDLRHEGSPGWACRWCHGAPGIGMARAAMLKHGGMDPVRLQADIRNALAGVEQGWPSEIDTLCCGTLGSVEFFCEAGEALDRSDLRQRAGQRLTAVVQAARLAGDYRWNSGEAKFNLGLFRGLAGVGYTLLRQADDALPNVLIWD